MASSHHAFSIREAVDSSFETVISHLKFFILLCLLLLGITVLSFVVQFIFNFQGERNDIFVVVIVGILGVVIAIIRTMVDLLINVGIVKIALNFVRGRKSKISDVFGKWRHALRFFVASILLAIPLILVAIVTMGSAMLMFFEVIKNIPIVIPILLIVLFVCFSFWWQIRFQFFSYFIVDKNEKIIASLQKSFHLTQGQFWKLLFLGIILLLINVVGFLILTVGLFITIPMSWIATAHVYTKLVDTGK